jgi:sucrose phosphorylase
MTAQAIMLALVGVPGIYFHSLFGSRSWHGGVGQTGRNRTINRQKFDLAMLESALRDETSLRHHVFRGYAQYLRARSSSPAFHPHGEQQVLDCGEASFALLRLSPDESQRVLCLHNVADRTQTVRLEVKDLFRLSADALHHPLTDLVTSTVYPSNDNLVLQPYQTLWLRIKE